MYNKFIMLGRLAKDIEVIQTKSGKPFAKGILISSRKMKFNGTETERKLFMECMFFGNVVETLKTYTKKGDLILVDGELQTDTWTDENGKNHSKIQLFTENMKLMPSRGLKPASDCASVNNETEPSEKTKDTITNEPLPKGGYELPDEVLEEIPF